MRRKIGQAILFFWRERFFSGKISYLGSAIPLKAGYASFHHPLLVHGSFANSSSSRRRATVVNTVKCDVTVTRRTHRALLPVSQPHFSNTMFLIP
jgi:ectoine hydroxylase-related dioxygenase (phytanoyl-CoA dioxygenase family)